MSVNEEKRSIIDCPGNVLVTANPGTGKTLLLAHKYVSLLNGGIDPKDILCLTFTKKARCEMQERITSLIIKEGLAVNVSDVNIHTFHSYALENLDEAYLVSTNLLRYAIFRFLKDHKTLSYSDRYLLDTIVPKMENLMRYLKSFGVCVDDIVVDDVKRFISDFKGFSKSELEQFLERFVDIFRYYEQMKGSHGVDYADMLIGFLHQPLSHRFSYVLVDELQDVNSMEAEIALRSAEQFIAVGDQKQAIFGFQGGSIINFERFKDSTKFVLSENFRSTNAILSYARSYFSSQTKESHHTFELEKLENKEKGFGKKPVVYDAEREDIPQLICRLAVSASERSSTVAIIARTNTQIMNISKELVKRNIEHSSTFFAASSEAQSSIITFIRALVHDDMQYVKAAMFTPFFPISIQDAFSLSEKKHLTFYDIYQRSPGFQKLRQSVTTIEDVYAVFEKRIIPVAISYGEEYLLASIGIMDAFREAMHLLDDKKIENIAAFLESTDLASSESHVEKKIVLTTVHKAKGKQFDEVIYVPVKTSDKTNFQDAVVKAILQSKGYNAEEELEEETLRVNFVAFTRAKNILSIVTDKAKDYVNEFSEVQTVDGDDTLDQRFSESEKRAYMLFVNKQYDEAKEMLEHKTCWIREFVKHHFDSLESISFSSLTTDPYEYLKNRILSISISSSATSLGSDVHIVAEKILEGEAYGVPSELAQYEVNIKRLVDEIHQTYPTDAFVEEKLTVPLKSLLTTDVDLSFSGKIDAVFKNDREEYLIVDWKTNRNTNNASEHRQQLSAYKKAFSLKHHISFDNIKVAIGYIGLRKIIDDGIIGTELDMRQPSSSSFDTFNKHIQIFLSWRKDVDVFFKDLSEVKDDDVLLRSVLEQYDLEKI